MNTRKYFDEHFEGVIKRNDENGQTIFFCNLAIKNFPGWLIEDLKKGLSFVDFGCAMGESVNIIQNKFKLSKVIGIDFSPVAIKEAKIKFPNNNFLCGSLEDLKKHYDVIFSSNTLEHFHNPLNKLKKIVNNADKYVILLLPFQEYERTESHFYTFDYDNIPVAIKDFNIVYVKVMSTWNMPNNHWPGTQKSPGKQILLIYAKKNHIDLGKLYLDSIISDNKLSSDLILQIDDLNLKLNRIYSSTFWKIVLVFYKFRDFIYSQIH